MQCPLPTNKIEGTSIPKIEGRRNEYLSGEPSTFKNQVEPVKPEVFQADSNLTKTILSILYLHSVS